MLQISGQRRGVRCRRAQPGFLTIHRNPRRLAELEAVWRRKIFPGGRRNWPLESFTGRRGTPLWCEFRAAARESRGPNGDIPRFLANGDRPGMAARPVTTRQWTEG